MTSNDKQARVLAEQWVRRWFCQNNEVLWERGGHYQEEVEALMVLLREAEARGLEEGAEICEGKMFMPKAADYLSRMAQVCAEACRAQAASRRGGG